MMKLLPALLILFSVSPAMAQDLRPFQAFQGDSVNLRRMLQLLLQSPMAKQLVPADAVSRAASPQPVLTQSSNIENKSILGPTGELLPPALATQQLRGDDYFEWCLRWNKQQYLEASRRAVPATQLRGQVSRRDSFVQGVNSNGSVFRRRGNAFNVASNSVTDSREQLWKVGGFGGGPVALYNPFVRKATR